MEYINLNMIACLIEREYTEWDLDVDVRTTLLLIWLYCYIKCSYQGISHFEALFVILLD